MVHLVVKAEGEQARTLVAELARMAAAGEISTSPGVVTVELREKMGARELDQRGEEMLERVGTAALAEILATGRAEIRVDLLDLKTGESLFPRRSAEIKA